MVKKMITENIATLVNYGIAAGLIDETDKIYTTNRLLELFGLEEIYGFVVGNEMFNV